MEDGNVLIVWDRIGDYHRARVAALKSLLEPGRILTADLGSADGLYGWANSGESEEHVVLSGKPVDERDFSGRLGAFRKLLRSRRIRYLGIAGYGKPEYLGLLILGRLHGCRTTLFAESWYGHNRLKNRLKGLFLKTTCSRFLVSGKRAREHFRNELGIPGNKILTGYSTVDNDHFDRGPSAGRKPVVLCVARFTPEKNLAALIDAFQASHVSEHFQLRLIGGGPERENLERRISKPDRVSLVDWVSYADLPAEYAQASVFVLPSLFEPWGLVVNEAMAAGLPVVVSRACGCQPDLVGPANGWVFDERQPGALLEVLNQVAQTREDQRLEMGKRSREIIGEYSCQAWAQQTERSFS